MPSEKKKLQAGAARMVDMVDYQEDSIVSKAIIDRKAGTVTLFVFDEGQGLSEHKAPYDALVHILDGEAKITVSGKEFDVKEGEMIVLPANKPHVLNAQKRFKMLLTMIRS